MGVKRRVYLDHSATTPVDPRVVQAMLPYFSEQYADSTASYHLGAAVFDTVEASRATIARVLNCHPSEIYFTSGGSAGDNHSLRQVVWQSGKQEHGTHVITSSVEHTAVLNTLSQLSDQINLEYSLLPVNRLGEVHPSDLLDRFRADTGLVSVMMVNNEVGTIQPIQVLSAETTARNIIFHTDAVQAAGQLSLDVQTLGVDMLSLSAHKFYGPKGIGLLYIRHDLPLAPPDESTLNTPLIVGMAKALEFAYVERDQRVRHFATLRDQLIDSVLAQIPGVVLTGHPTNRLPSHASFLVDGVDGNTLVTHLDLRGVAASSASACKTGNPEPSSVLLAMGYSPKDAMGSLRLTVGLQTTPDDIDYAVNTLADVVPKLRKLNREFVL